jgi:hypothetical protein
MADLDRETDFAAELLVRRIRRIGDADLEVVAREYVMTLRSRGWRPVMDLPPPLTGPVSPGGDGLPRAAEVRRLVEAAKDACEAATPWSARTTRPGPTSHNPENGE